jgi:hypothetical protein
MLVASCQPTTLRLLGVHHEGDEDQSSPAPAGEEVGDPQFVQRLARKSPLDEIGPAVSRRVGFGWSSRACRGAWRPGSRAAHLPLHLAAWDTLVLPQHALGAPVAAGF